MKSACQKNVYVLLLHFLTLSHFVTGDSGFRIGCTANETNGTVVVEWVKESVQFTTEVIGSKWLRLCVADTSKSRERERNISNLRVLVRIQVTFCTWQRARSLKLSCTNKVMKSPNLAFGLYSSKHNGVVGRGLSCRISICHRKLQRFESRNHCSHWL